MAESTKLNLYQKLAKIRKQLEVIQKDSSGYGYKYVSEAEILSKLSVWLNKYNLLLIPKIVPSSSHFEMWDMEQTSKKAKDGSTEKKCEVIVGGDMVFTWVNTENPIEQLEVPWFFTGQQADASQAFGSGLTYCTRYFLLKFFNIATIEDDPDSWRSKQKNAEKEESVLIAKEITQKVDDIAKKYVTDSADVEKAKADVLTLSKKYVKGGNYTKIEEPAIASKLLEEIKKLANVKEEK